MSAISIHLSKMHFCKLVSVSCLAAVAVATVDLPPLPPLIVSLLLDMIGAMSANATLDKTATQVTQHETETGSPFHVPAETTRVGKEVQEAVERAAGTAMTTLAVSVTGEGLVR